MNCTRHWRQRPLIVLAAAWMLASCSSWRAPAAEPLRLPPAMPPAALMSGCEPPPGIQGSAEVDAVILALKHTYDAYGLCAWRHRRLIDWLEQVQ